MDILFSSPAVFFAMGLLVASLQKHVHLPKDLIRFLSLYLVISIGLKGGVELHNVGLFLAIKSLAAGVSMGIIQGAVLFYALRKNSSFNKKDITSFVAHYGSVSVGTFMVAVSFLKNQNISFESELYLFLVAMECPAILLSLAFHQLHSAQSGFHLSSILKRVFYHETIIALLFSLCIGSLADAAFITSLKPFYSDLFPGLLTFFMICMGAEVANYWHQIKNVGTKFIWLGIAIQIAGGLFGLFAGILLGLSTGGLCLLMVLTGSASYIAAPCVMRESLPEANNSAIFLTVLGITFPINIVLGIKVYYAIALLI